MGTSRVNIAAESIVRHTTQTFMIMTSKMDQDALYSGAKIEPLKSPVKYHQPHSDHGVLGEDFFIQETHEAPLDSPLKHHHLQQAHAETHGVCGYDDIIQSTKIAPMDGKMKQRTTHEEGLDMENIDASRIAPMGEVREE